ncbi:MAG TPA: thiolase family protein [Acidimicrobiales bacterium]|nr:thiolase family protein [Acidimicrobiales bacterium]
MPRGIAARKPVIAGLGLTELGKVYGRSAASLAAEAVTRAVEDAGMALADLDGLLTSNGVSGGVGLGLQGDLGLRELKLLSEMQSFGSTAGAMVQVASMAVNCGMADAVACVFADAPLRPGRGAGEVYSAGRRPDRPAGAPPSGWGGLLVSTGVAGANTMYALAARRHMLRYGTTEDDLAAVAVAQREWAARNPLAQMRDPITVEDHHNSRWIAEPFRKLDCCLVSNGAVAVVVTSAERAAHLAKPPVHVLGWAQRHPGYQMRRDPEFGLVSGAARSGPDALAMAGVALDEVQVAELYDCYTYTVIVSLEDYGFCAKGEGGAFVSGGGLARPDERGEARSGRLKLNTGGGQLSSYYMWGMTPLSEAVIQVRGEGGDRQVHPHDVALVSGNGGILDHHSTLVLGSEAAA